MRTVVACLIVSVLFDAATAQAQELIERTLVIVSGRVITLADVRTALALGLVEGGEASDGVDHATEQLIDRTLMLREVQHYAPPEPSAAALDARMNAVRERFASPEAFTHTLQQGGFSEERLRAWLRDDLRLAAYLDQRFAAAGAASDQDVSEYYAEHRGEFEVRGLSFEQAAPLIRERLGDERRRELITDWVSDLRRRAEIRRIEGAAPFLTFRDNSGTGAAAFLSAAGWPAATARRRAPAYTTRGTQMVGVSRRTAPSSSVLLNRA